MSVFDPSRAYWENRETLAEVRPQVEALSKVIENEANLTLAQWAQLLNAVWQFKPDLVLELGRLRGNSTCAFTLAANRLLPRPCKVVSVCLSEDWEDWTYPRVAEMMADSWFDPLSTVRGDILEYDFAPAIDGASRVLVFWDAHGFDVAECVLGNIMPKVADREHVVLLHDLSDARYIPGDSRLYGAGLWKGGIDPGGQKRLRIGNVDSATEEAIAAVDFTSRNNIPLNSIDHNLNTELGTDDEKVSRLEEQLGGMFSLSVHLFWFSLAEGSGEFTFPEFVRPVKRQFSILARLKLATKVLLNRFPAEKLLP